MLKGDLASTPLAPLLVQLAEEAATGCLHISDAEADEALIYYKTGLVYAVSVPGRRPQLGAKLISSGALAPEALADALEAQRTELQGWRLGELLVHLGYVDQPVVEAFIKEQVHDALWDLIKWDDGRWKFRKGEKTREDVAPPMPVVDLLADLRERGHEWQTISTVVHGPTAVPVLSARGGGEPETTLDADAWSMLCKIDGERTVAELARDCGYTLFEAGQVVVALVNAGLVDIEEDLEVAPAAAVDEPADELYGANSVSSALAADAATAGDEIVGDDRFADLARLVTEVAASVREEARPEPPVELPSRVRISGGNDQSFAASIERVSQALSDVLGPPQEYDPFEVPAEVRIRQNTPQQRRPVTEEEARKTRARQAAAAELAAAHALAEALRAAQKSEAQVVAEPEAPVAEVVDLAAVRREAEAARLEEERLAAELAARAEAERLADEAARIAAEEEAARLEAERLAAEEAARIAAEEEIARIAAAEEAARLEAERLAAEEAARLEAERLEAERLEAERLEAERLEAERLAAEEAARVEAERLAAEEAARIAAEEEAARLEAERLAAEEAARIAAEEEAARVEAERLAAEEEAARLEAERLEAERLAAEETARLEAARIAAEEEAARMAAEEAARLEAERLAAEESARLAAEEEAARLETARSAAERAEAEAEAWAEYWAREARAAEVASQREAAASALLTQLSAEPVAQEPEADAVEEEPAVEEPEVREPAAVGARAFPAANEMADTAALLRELSSLGLEDDSSSPPAARPPAPRPASRPAANEKKKKRGLFGF